jgi:hypothetical protein
MFLDGLLGLVLLFDEGYVLSMMDSFMIFFGWLKMDFFGEIYLFDWFLEVVGFYLTG